MYDSIVFKQIGITMKRYIEVFAVYNVIGVEGEVYEGGGWYLNWMCMYEYGVLRHTTYRV